MQCPGQDFKGIHGAQLNNQMFFRTPSPGIEHFERIIIWS